MTAAALRVRLALAERPLRAALADLWRPDGVTARYGAYLRTMHAVIRASVPLMELAARRCAERPADPAAEPLGAYLAAHAEEERAHDDWLLDDLGAAGLDPADARDGLPPPAVARLVGPQYYWVEHFHPVALLGYIAVLEGNAPAPWLADRLAGTTGLPAAAFRTVRAHAVLDGRHTADLDDLLDRLPLTAAQHSAVGVSALHTVAAATDLFRTLAGPPTDPPSGGQP